MSVHVVTFHCRKAILSLGVCASALLSQTPTSFAQEDSALETITVTARKRSETIQDVPLSIQAFTAEALDTADIDGLDDLADYTPGLTLFENVDRGYGQVFIRGLQNTPPVGDTTRELASVFIDGIFFTGGVSAINTDNIERVEVIRGPQSALFGRATFSGAINFITKTPGNEFAGNIRAYAATDDEYEISASVEGPIVKDVLAGRLSGRFRDFGGQYTNTLNGDALGEEQDLSFSGQLYFTPTENFSAKLTANYLEQQDGAPSTSLVGRTPNQNFTSPSGAMFVRGELTQDVPIAQNRFPTNASDIRGFDPGTFSFPEFDTLPGAERLGLRRNGLDREFVFVSLDLNYEFADGYSVSYLGSYSDENANRLFDFEFSPENNYFGQRNTDSTSHMHELRLTSPGDDRLRWLVGGSYFNQSLFERDPGPIFGSDIPFFGPGFIEPGQVAVLAGPRPVVDRDIDTWALFGSIAYDFTEQLTVSFEGRYQDDKLEDVVDPIVGSTLSGSTSAFLPRLFLEYSPNEDVLIYASAARGLRPTTINSQFASRTDAEQAAIRQEFPELDIDLLAPPETIWTYEIGAKTSWLDGRGIFNINLYYSDWKDSQDLQSLLAPIGPGGSPLGTLVTVNGADIKAYGIEIDGVFAVTEQVTLNGAFSWNETELKGTDANISRFFLDQSAGGARLPQTPRLSGSFAGTYRDALGVGDYEWFARLEGIYVGTRYASTLNLAETGSSFDLNVRLGIENERYSAQFFVTNLTQDETFESARSNADCATTAACTFRAYEVVLPRRRQFGLILQAKF